MSTLNVSAIKNPSAGSVAITLDTSGNAAAPSLVPPGTVQFYAGSTAPAGWVKANGAALSRATYAALFAAIGTTFGGGDGVSTFTLPDLRGEFLRGWDDGRGVDTGRSFGNAQSFAMQNITGGIVVDSANSAGAFISASGIVGQSGGLTSVFLASGGSTGSRSRGFDIDASRVAQTSTETRPRNVALLAIIKF